MDLLLPFKFSLRVVSAAAALAVVAVAFVNYHYTSHLPPYEDISGPLSFLELISEFKYIAPGLLVICFASDLRDLIVFLLYRRGGEVGDFGLKLTEEFAKISGLKEYSNEELMIATNSFANDRILGRGGFGIVYKGHVGDASTPVAIKMMNPNSHQGIKEYMSEVKSLSQLRHKNLVQLEGYCHEANRFALVYEFIGGGSLEDHLFKPEKFLEWGKRYEIARGLASALHYLHEEYHDHECVIHRDIKSSNIMLTEKFVAKLGDFGLARLVDHARGQKTTEKMGTLGYAAPEYHRTGKASKQSDIYSFGVVLLEIVCGRRAVFSLHGDLQNLVEWVWKHYGRWSWSWRRNFLLVVDERLRKDFVKKQAEALLIVGLWCTQPDAGSRPSTEEAMAVLNLKAKHPKLPSKMPSFNI
ncbi:hypothetical protein EUGRSUZ_E00615 [Eucalyptus grandis]|uniref:Protein kinase domain-containing protein n=4 Tax=Eucalyptus grandis TaxID=71139 RepID=A0A059C113_EUCGR|nr:hypothetical protein EUGRSUZ_E00615 [Eucalyptus grandis]